MSKIIKIILFLISILLFVYVSLPDPEFPPPPLGSLQSTEPADTETPLRRAYFTNLNRQEVIDHYKNEFNKGFAFYTPRLNYPPEEAQTIIRDQTRSTYLEEIVHPLRESLFINGFEPKSEKDTIIIENKVWQQKIIVRLVPSSLAMRLFVLAFTIVSALLLMREYEIWQKKN